ncbi:FtsX-like permease family protein [bacterium]|nr:FtsX-like permease family protein [bacterium]
MLRLEYFRIMSAPRPVRPPLRLKSSYASVVVSMALVLFLLGLLGFLWIQSDSISRSVRERFALHLHLSDDATEADRSRIVKALQLNEATRSVSFVSKDSAAAELEAELDEEFVEFLGFNPLQDAFELHLKAEYTEPEKIAALAQELGTISRVDRVSYDKPLLEMLYRNLRRMGLVLGGAGLLMLLISIMLINSSIRLAIYSRRFLIRTMQLVGATKGFIQAPFIRRGLMNGLLGALLALILLSATAWALERSVGNVLANRPWVSLALLALGVISAGLLISGISTYFAVRRYLGLKTDQLYF